jgi:hypothetical protein
MCKRQTNVLDFDKLNPDTGFFLLILIRIQQNPGYGSRPKFSKHIFLEIYNSTFYQKAVTCPTKEVQTLGVASTTKTSSSETKCLFPSFLGKVLACLDPDQQTHLIRIPYEPNPNHCVKHNLYVRSSMGYRTEI